MMLSSPRHGCRGFRTGNTLTAVLISLAVCGGVLTAMIVLRPARIGAAPRGGEPVAPAAEAHRAMVDNLQRLLGGSREILAMHRDPLTRRLDVVLWVSDGPDPGIVNVRELALVAYSPILQTLEVYVLDGENAGEAYCHDWWIVEEAFDPSFPQRWRQCDEMKRSVITTGLSDFRAEVAKRGSNGAALLRVDLKWGGETVDGSDDGRLLVDVALRSGAAQE